MACLSINDVDEDARVVSPDFGRDGQVLECGECFSGENWSRGG